MKIAIVPNGLRDEINAKLDAAIAACPDAESDREYLYSQLLTYFDEHGVLPEFTVSKEVTP